MEASLTLMQRQVYRDFVTSFQRLQNNLNPRMIGLADVPPEIKRKFISDRGRFLLQIHPAVNIWDREPSTLYPLAVITSYLLVGSLLVAVVALSHRDRRWARRDG